MSKKLTNTKRNFLLEIMEDKIIRELLPSLNIPNKEYQKEYNILFKIKLNSLITKKLKENNERYLNCSECDKCYNLKYDICIHKCLDCGDISYNNYFIDKEKSGYSNICDNCYYEQHKLDDDDEYYSD